MTGRSSEARNGRVKWLLQNQGLWAGVRKDKRLWIRDIKITMKNQGLYSQKTNLGDMRVWELICEARQIREEGRVM